MVFNVLAICIYASSWIKTFPSVLLLGEYPCPKESDYE